MIEGQPPRAERMTGLAPGQLADLVGRVREVVGPWENPPVGRPHVLPLPAAVVAVLSGLRHNVADDVVGQVFGCSQATITRYHQILQPILRWVTRPEVDQRHHRAQRAGVLVDGFVAPVGERDDYHGLFSGKKHLSGQNAQVIVDRDGRVADVGDPVPGARHILHLRHRPTVGRPLRPLRPRHDRRRRLPGHRPTHPAQETPGGDLTTKQKTYNYSLNRLRAAVERAISHLKNWKILKTGYHRIMTDFPDVTGLEIIRTATQGFDDPPGRMA
jgi:hypothetical protein